MLILLDGSKGAGKSTTSKILIQYLNNVDYLSIDTIRRSLQNQERSRADKNKEAFGIIITTTSESLKSGRNVIVDCGLIPGRIKIFENLANETNSKIYKFFRKKFY